MTIIGYVFNDLDGDGNWDRGEPALEGWAIHLGPVSKAATSDSDGHFEFTDLEPGTYTLAEELQDEWVLTTATDVEVMVQSGSIPDEVLFGNFQLVTIEAEKFNDLNGNGDIDEGELLIYGWDLTLTYPDGTTDTMDSPAAWTVGQGGTYKVMEALQDGWISTTANSVVITVQSGDSPPALFFGNFELGEIRGYKLNDLNGNGIRNEGEPNLEGWTIHLDGYDTITENEVHRTAVTDSQGYYEFKGLTAGTYTVSEELKPGWIQTKPGPFGTYTVEIKSGTTSGSNDFYNLKLVCITADKWDDLNGDGVRDKGEREIPGWGLTISCPNGTTNTMDSPASWVVMQKGTYTITEELQDGWVPTTASSVDVTVVDYESTPDVVWFGNFKLGEISGYKWDDTNGDGIWENGEPPLEDWEIALTKGSSTMTAKTDENGYYEFTDLIFGTYIVEEVLQSGWVQTCPMDSGTNAVQIASGSDVNGKDFGNFRLVTITADKWNDLDCDGQRDQGEPEILGWDLTIRCPNGTTNTMDSPASWTVKRGGKYIITEEMRCGWASTTASSLDLVVQSGSAPSTVWFGNWHARSWLSDTSDKRIEVTDFSIVFTPSKGTYKISSTNPGGFYFNVLYRTGTDPTTISYALANNGDGDFVTKGSMPVHAYAWDDIDKDGRIDYWSELTDVTNKITTAQEPNLSKGTIKIKGVPSGTNMLIAIHITFALKGTSGYDLNGARAYEGKPYTFMADDGFIIQATLNAHVKI